MDAIVLDAHLRTGVAGVRALGRSGLRLGVAGSGRLAAGLRSRYAAAAARLPPSDGVQADFARGFAALRAEWGPAPVYAASDATLLALLAIERESDGALTLPYASPESVLLLHDKRRLPELARAAGLASVPSSFEGRIREIDPEKVPFPCVVKAASAPPEESDAASLDRSHLAGSPAELRAELDGADPDLPVVVQPQLAGPLMAVSVVLDRDGRVVARFQQRALRTWPRQAGSSSVAVGVEAQDDLVERSARVLREAGFWGLAELQFIDTSEGPRLIDVNPRFYGSMPLAVASGANLPAAWHAVVVGDAPPSPGPYRVGVVFRWLEADVVAVLRGSHRCLGAGVHGPRVGAMWSTDDPLPGVLLALDAAGTRGSRVLRRRVTRRRSP